MTDKPMTIEGLRKILIEKKKEYECGQMKFPLTRDMTSKESHHRTCLRGSEIAINWVLEKIGGNNDR